jgi:predicted O-methyltransferase YrrM
MTKRGFTSDWFSENIPTWERLIIPLLPKTVVRCLEIGSWEGRSACWIVDNILQHHPDSHLDCVDLWPNLQEQERLFDRNLSTEPKVTKHKGFSINFLVPLIDQTAVYDFIYVDGDHRGEMAFTDSTLAWHCLKVGGVMAMDDYIYDGWEIAGLPKPKLPIDAFLAIHANEIRVLEKAHQVIVQKTTPGSY